MRKAVIIFTILDIIVFLFLIPSLVNKINLNNYKASSDYPTLLTYYFDTQDFKFELSNEFFTFIKNNNKVEISLSGFSNSQRTTMFSEWIKDGGKVILPPSNCKFIGIDLFFNNGQSYEPLNSPNNFSQFDSKNLIFAKYYRLVDQIKCFETLDLVQETKVFVE